MTPFEKIGLIYGAWLAICGIAAWYLARWSAQRQLNGMVFAVLVVLALINLGQLGYIFVLGQSIITRPRNGFEKFLQHTDLVWHILYALWPFATAIGIAQTTLKVTERRPVARWISFGCSVGIAALTPLILIFVTCGLAGMCLN